MQKYKIEISDLAEQDLEFAADYDPVLAGLGVRMDYYKNYKIYYVVEDKLVIIVRILHMLVDSRAWLYRTFGMKD